jgi:MFS family permease
LYASPALYTETSHPPIVSPSPTQFLAGLVAASQATTFTRLMAARCVHTFGAGICEALPVQLVNDIFFMHERGKRIDYYTVCLCLASVAPLVAGSVLSGGHSWRLYFYVCFAFGLAVFVLTVLVVEETSYDRAAALLSEAAPPLSSTTSHENTSENEKQAAGEVLSATNSGNGPHPRPARHTSRRWPSPAP